MAYGWGRVAAAGMGEGDSELDWVVVAVAVGGVRSGCMGGCAWALVGGVVGGSGGRGGSGRVRAGNAAAGARCGSWG